MQADVVGKPFIEEGAEGFARNVPPTPFDWSAGNFKRPRLYFDTRIGDEARGRIKFELLMILFQRMSKTLLHFQQEADIVLI